MKINMIAKSATIFAFSAVCVTAATAQSQFDARPMNSGPPNMMMMPMGQMMQPMSEPAPQPMEKPMMKKHMSKKMMKKKMMQDGAAQ